jgi:hypothetical protein
MHPSIPSPWRNVVKDTSPNRHHHPHPTILPSTHASMLVYVNHHDLLVQQLRKSEWDGSDRLNGSSIIKGVVRVDRFIVNNDWAVTFNKVLNLDNGSVTVFQPCRMRLTGYPPTIHTVQLCCVE